MIGFTKALISCPPEETKVGAYDSNWNRHNIWVDWFLSEQIFKFLGCPWFFDLQKFDFGSFPFPKCPRSVTDFAAKNKKKKQKQIFQTKVQFY